VDRIYSTRWESICFMQFPGEQHVVRYCEFINQFIIKVLHEVLGEWNRLRPLHPKGGFDILITD